MKDYVNSAALQEYTTKLVAKLKTLFPGTPTAAATVADMTDHSKTYVYVGSETGYTAGDWYYWDGTAWTSGGPFQATSIITDTTLAVAGEAADAKATGDAIAAAKTAVLNAMAPAYSTSATYAVGDYVNYNGSIYRCSTAIATAESWTSGHWTAVVLGADLAAQVSDLKTHLTETEETKTYTDITPTSNHTGNRVYYNSTYNLIAQDSAGTTKKYNVYAITPGKYQIYGYGDNNVGSVMAVVGNADIATSGAVNCGLLEVITIPGESVSYGWHRIEVDITSTGYLYVNCSTTFDSVVKSVITEETLVPITDKSMANSTLPANAKVTGDLAHYRGVYIDNGDYYHFVRNGENNIIRKFVRRGPNNLFQWNQIILGDISEDGVSADTSYTAFGTDIVGPISIWNGTLFPGKYGAWSGGNHGKTVDNVECATAVQIDFKCLVNGTEVSNDGLYYGDVQFVATNKLYFPQSITGADLSTATLAIIEHRKYDIVGTEMKVRVWLECKEDIRVALYYGMQMADIAFDSVFCLNNGFVKELTSITEIENLPEKERKIILTKSANGLTLSMYMSDIGLGNYNLNDGSEGYVTLPSHGSGGTKKTYYKLIYKSPTQPSISAGSNLVWEGVYDLYFG